MKQDDTEDSVSLVHISTFDADSVDVLGATVDGVYVERIDVSRGIYLPTVSLCFEEGEMRPWV